MAQYEIDNRPWRINMQGTDPVKRTLQNCKNLLMTKVGEVPFDRDRGFDSRLLVLPMPMLKAELNKELERMLLWEKNATLVSSECSLDENNEVYIKMIVEVQGEVEDE